LNIYDIAKLAGVSIATVSRVINGKENVSEKTRQKVERIIAEMGYTPNVFARGLGLGSIQMVGVLCSTVSDLFYARAVATIESELRTLGYDVILCCTGNDVAEKSRYMQLLLSKRVDAMILVGSIFQERTSNEHIAQAATQVPVILVNGSLDIPNTYCVFCDEEGAVYHLVRALAAENRRDILYIENTENYASLSKWRGFTRGCADCNISHSPALTLQVPKDGDAVKERVISLIDSGVTFNAVVASEDLLALGALKALKARKLRVPEDVAVVGFNDSILCKCSSPELSSIDNKVDDMCRRAVAILLELIRGRNPPTRTVLTPEFKRRDSF
jgi:LacI family transcriptional regulator